MENVFEDIRGMIGNTPILKINHMGVKPGVNVYAKLELMNPAGSVKDRVGVYMIDDAIERGLLRSTENEILMYRVTDIEMIRTLFQKIFGLGTLVVYSHDKTNPTLEIKNIKHVREFKDTLSDAVEKDRIRMKMRQSEIVDGAYDFHDHDIDF